jgi:hypothetical protein
MLPGVSETKRRALFDFCSPYLGTISCFPVLLVVSSITICAHLLSASALDVDGLDGRLGATLPVGFSGNKFCLANL